MKLILLLLLFQPYVIQASSSKYFISNQKLLHKTSDEIASMFTPSPDDKVVDLEFSFDSIEHGNIRRIRETGVMDSEDESNTTLPHFDKQMYDCMIPEGPVQKTSTLAVISFLARLNGSTPTFEITMDRMNWFSIGDIKKEEKNDSLVYEVTLMVRENIDIKMEATKNSVYRFIIEGNQDGEKNTSIVKVEILSFSPTTPRVLTTTEQTSSSMMPSEGSGEEMEIEASGESMISTMVPTTESTTTHQMETTTEQVTTTEELLMEDQNLVLRQEKTDSVEGSGESFEKNEGLLQQSEPMSDAPEDERPLTETMSSSAQMEEKEAEMELLINGTNDNLYILPTEHRLSSGDQLKGLSIGIRLKNEKSSRKIRLSLDHADADLFTIRPNQIPSNAKAYLFVNNLRTPGDISIKIVATDDEVGKSTSKMITIRNPAIEVDPSKRLTQLVTTVFNVNENVPSGTTIGKIEDGNELMIVSQPSIFALVGGDILLSCNNEMPCLDHERQAVHYILLRKKDGSLPIHEVVINVNDVNDHIPQLVVTDEVIRILDNQIIGAFAIEILDKDSNSRNEINLEGKASSFLGIEAVSKDLYQLKVTGNTKTGRHDLQIILTDGTSRIEKTIHVLVQRANSHAHFRRSRYERSIKMENIEKGEEIIRVELEGIPIDEAKFVILKGNPGWLKIDDYGGSLIVTTDELMTSSAFLTIGAINRQSGQLLAETVVVLNVMGIPEKENRNDIFSKKIYEKTMDREASKTLEIELDINNSNNENKMTIDRSSVFAVDENAQIKEINMKDINIQGNKISLSKEAASDLRIVRFDIMAKDQKATVIFHLNSSEDYALHRKRMANRAIFSPRSKDGVSPVEITILEEEPIGRVIMLAPAINPMSGEMLESRIVEGQEDFKLHPETGAIELTHQFDYDTMTPSERTRNLKIAAGEGEYETSLNILVHIQDIDDNAPLINRDGIPSQLMLPENLAVNTTIAKIMVSDKDEISMKKGLNVKVDGEHSELYNAVVVNNTIILTVAGLLDREQSPSHAITLTLTDSAGNQDKISLVVILNDENDNVPHFLHEKYDVQVVENWPKGLVIEQLKAIDMDSGINSELIYSLSEEEIDYFQIDSNTGDLSIAKDLLGIAREEPYAFTAMVADKGEPSLNYSVPIRVKVLENIWPKNEGFIDFVEPSLDYVLNLPENTKINEVIYQAKAKVRTHDSSRQHMHIKYSLTENNETSRHFKIDESTGEIMLTEPLDYEKQRSHFLVLKAEHLLLNSSNTRLWRVQVENVDDNAPVFINSSSILYNLRSLVPIGRISAYDADGDPVYYRIIPSCSPYSHYFSIDEEYGEISFNRKEDDVKEHRITLCAIARSQKTLLDPELKYDERRTDMIKFIVEKEREKQFIIPDMTSYNNTITTIDPNLRRLSIPVNMHSSSSSSIKLNSTIIRVQYTPCADMLPETTPKTPLNQLFEIDDETNAVRISPKLGSEHLGVYKVSIATDTPNETYMINQEYHLINEGRKSKYVFDLPASELSRNIRGFQRRLSNAMSADHPSVPMKVVVDKPMTMNNNRSRSYVCFHTVQDGKIISPDAALASLSISNVGSSPQLAQLYNKYHIINIQECDDSDDYVSSASIFSNPTMNIWTILAYLGISFLILLPFIIIVFFCFVRRYRDYIRNKEKALKAPPSDMSHSPSLQQTPTFLLAPSAVTSMGPIGYWD